MFDSTDRNCDMFDSTDINCDMFDSTDRNCDMFDASNRNCDVFDASNRTCELALPPEIVRHCNKIAHINSVNCVNIASESNVTLY
jgi:hypothetical protein